MKKQLLLLLAIVAMLFGCSEDVLLDDYAKSADENAPQSEMIKENKGKAVTKTIKIRTSGMVNYTCLEYDGDNCSVYLAEAYGEGNASHLGLFTIELSYYAGPDFFPISPISGVQTAANGDQLNTVAYGPNPDGSIHFICDGGTGRFEDVTGYVDLFFDWADNEHWSNYGEGEITY